MGNTLAIAGGALALVAAIVTLLTQRRLPHRVWRLLSFFGCLVLPFIGMTGLSGTAMEQSKTTEFCNSCHAMNPYHDSLLIDDDEYIPAVHYQNNYVNQQTACYDCHTDYGFYGGVKGKLNGLKHVWVNYVGTVPDTLELYEPYNTANCLRCHSPSKKFRKKKQHRIPEGRLEEITSGQKSCMSSGCHDVNHEAHEFRKGSGSLSEGDDDD